MFYILKFSIDLFTGQFKCGGVHPYPLGTVKKWRQYGFEPPRVPPTQKSVKSQFFQENFI